MKIALVAANVPEEEVFMSGPWEIPDEPSESGIDSHVSRAIGRAIVHTFRNKGATNVSVLEHDEARRVYGEWKSEFDQ